ncbi:MAG TPA: hypothetical protein VIV60_25520 [Polyangiaceae bacterium]
MALVPLKQVTVREMREASECEDDDPTPDGLWDADTETIYLLRKLSNKQKRVVLFHEVIHCANDNNYWSRLGVL